MFLPHSLDEKRINVNTNSDSENI